MAHFQTAHFHAYSRSRSHHEPAESFDPCLIRENPLYFLDYLRGKSLVKYYREETAWSDLDVLDLDRLLRPKLPDKPIRTVLSALLNRQVVSIDYRKKNIGEGEPTVRSLSPNHLVFADNRYHLRAYCHRRDAYLDFVLSRITHAEILEELEWVSSRGDVEWETHVDLCFAPNPALPDSARDAMLRSYDDGGEGCRKIRCRKAVGFYLRRKFLARDEGYDMPLWVEVSSASSGLL